MNINAIQSVTETIGKNCCLVYSYIYSIGIKPDAIKYYEICFNAIKAGVNISGVAPDCTVENAERFLYWLTGKRYSVLKKVVASLDNIKEAAPVRFNAPGFIPHFVVVENGVIVFDGEEDSKSVKYGRPIDARIIKKIED